METKDVNVFTRDWLLCTKSFGDFVEGIRYFLSITLEPNIYMASDENDTMHKEVEISDEDLFSHFTNEKQG